MLVSRVLSVSSVTSPVPRMKKPKYGKEARQDIVDKWEKKRQANLEQWERKEIENHVFQKRNDRFVRLKASELENFDSYVVHNRFVK